MVLLQRKLYFSKDRGDPTFSRMGVQVLTSIETHITCDFPGGGGSGPPITPSGSAHGLIVG